MDSFSALVINTKQVAFEKTDLNWESVTLIKHKRLDFDLVAFNMIWWVGCLVHLFVMDDNVLTASVTVIKHSFKIDGPLVEYQPDHKSL